MKLQPRMLLVFAITVLAVIGVLFYVSRAMLLSNFRALETQQMREYMDDAMSGVSLQEHDLGKTTNDYAYWDRTYAFASDPKHADIGVEFKDASMDGLELDYVLILDTKGRPLYAKHFDRQSHEETAVPVAFLQNLFKEPQLSLDTLEYRPIDGLLAFPDGDYMVSLRPILTSERNGPPLGIFLTARRFDESGAEEANDVTRATVSFDHFQSPTLPGFAEAARAVEDGGEDIAVRPVDNERVSGYTRIDDIFGRPLLLLRADTDRAIYQRGKLAQVYLFAAVSGGIAILSLVVLSFLQHFVLSRLEELNSDVESIGKRKAIGERVRVSGSDELSMLGNSINRMLEELELSQQQFQLITRNISQIFWIRNCGTGEIEQTNGNFEKIWGFSNRPQDANPAGWLKFVHEEDREPVAEALAEQMLGRETDTHFRIIASDGQVRWVWDRAFPHLNSQGELCEILGLTEDITEFKHHEEALMEAQEDLEARVQARTAELAERSEVVNLLLEYTPVAMYGMDHSGYVTFCNPAALKLLGFSDSSELLGRHAHTLFHHSRADGSAYPMEECPIVACYRDGVTPRVTDEVFWRKDSTAMRVGYQARQIRREGQVVGAVVSFADLTDRKREEMELQQRRKLEAVGRLAAGIAHEINTPIQFVRDNTTFLQESFRDGLRLVHKYQELHDKAKHGAIEAALVNEISELYINVDWEFLEKEIPQATEQMLDGLGRVAVIVRGMKEFSHVDRSDAKSPGDINRAIESTLVVANNELKYVADVVTNLQTIPKVPCYLGDLNQVFLNLLINAAHAIQDVVANTGGKGKITVTTRVDGDAVEVAISDTGTGVPVAVRDKIFDPFFTTKGVGKGTGQGLALAHAVIVDKHGGTLTFESEAGKGTTFFVRLPLKDTKAPVEVLAS